MLMTGIGSGIDFESMIGAIIAAERAPKDNQLNRQQGMNSAEIDALKEVQSAINTFRDKVDSLNSSRELQKLKPTLSNEDVLTATVDSAAVAGEYGFEVTQLAQAQREQLFKVTEGTTFKTGTIGFDGITVEIPALITKLDGEQKTQMDTAAQNLADKLSEELGRPVLATDSEVTDILADTSDPRGDLYREYEATKTRLNADGVTLEEIQSAINNDPANDGVKATLVRSGTDVSMVLNAKDTGSTNGFTINSSLTATDYSGAPAVFEGYDPATPLQTAKDAKVMFGAMELTSSTNKMENVIDGITLNLKETGTVNVKVERDEASVKGNIKGFVEAYNAVMETVNTYTKSSEDSAAALSGDSATRSMVSRLRSVVGAEYTTSTYQTLSQLGVTTTRQGTLEIDQSKLDKALEDDFEAVSKLFLGDGTKTGMMDSMLTVLDDYHKNGGTFDRRIDQLEYNNQRVTEQREQLDARMEAKTISLRDYYAKMDSKIASMNQTQSMLIGMLG